MANSLVWNLIINDRGAAGARSFRNQLEQTRRASDENGFSIARMSDKIGTMAVGTVAATGKIAALTVGMANAAPAVAGVAGAVASASGALGLLPAAIGAVVVAQAAFKLGTAGVSDALKLAAEGGEEYQAALEDLAPSQRSFVKAVAAQADSITKLKNDIGQNLFAGLSSEIKPLAGTYLPMLSKHLSATAGGFNQAGRATAWWLKQTSTVGKFNVLLGNSSKVVKDFAAGFQPIVAGLLNIGTASSRELVKLTGGIGSAADRFEAWTEKLTDGGKGGKFGAWVREGVSTLGKFGQVAKGVGGIIASIFKAAGGSSSGTSGLDRLVATLAKIRVEVDKPAFQTGLRRVFDAIAKSSAAVSEQIPKVLAAVAELAPAFSNVIEGGGESFAATLSVIGNMARLAAPGVNAMTEALLPMAPILGTLVPFLFLFSKALKLWSIIGPIVAATRLWIIAQGGLNAVLLANPLGLVIAAVALFVGGLVLAYKKSALFRYVVQTSFKAAANFVLTAVHRILGGFASLFDTLGKLPGRAGKAFRSAAASARTAQNKVKDLQRSINTLHGKQVRILVRTEYRDVFDSESRRDVNGRRGASAEGGMILAGAAHIVGEKGPEISMPATDRLILPAGITQALRAPVGGGTTIYNLHVDGSIISTKRELRKLILDCLADAPAGAEPPSRVGLPGAAKKRVGLPGAAAPPTASWSAR